MSWSQRDQVATSSASDIEARPTCPDCHQEMNIGDQRFCVEASEGISSAHDIRGAVELDDAYGMQIALPNEGLA
jgi:hypothetical protein